VHLEMFSMQTATHNQCYSSQTSTREKVQRTHVLCRLSKNVSLCAP